MMARHALWDNSVKNANRLSKMRECRHYVEFKNESDARKSLQEEWIKENCSGWWWSEDYHDWLLYKFSEETDAIYFKLRWS